MKRIHHLSGILLTGFIGLHLLNHGFAIFGAERHIAFMDHLRILYRHPLIETLLLAAVCMQIFSGIRLAVRKRRISPSFFGHLQIWSGLYLALFLCMHVSAVLVGRMLLHLDTHFYFGVAGLNTFPLNLFFIPYYGLAILAFFGHIAAIHSQKMTRHILGLPPDRQAWGICGLGLVVLVIIFYGLTNGFSGVEIPAAYQMMKG
ncbi:hypothetical protein [Pontibacter sp. G13]|uniref:hypothetical protein n=1 Tax=Pontibacter sp. G13 TaxID=3074898 RepID=UPI00288BF21E|nr:hypothetical protein [Pontibacter sp. G13]WNJ17106.1 hypothetical protein RJD25_19805 [Pontibacter sp. G13]